MNDLEIDLDAAFGDGKPPEPSTPEDEFIAKMTAGTIQRIGNFRYMLNAGELPKFQFLKEKGIRIQREVEKETKPIPGAQSAKPIKTRTWEDLPQEEYIKLSLEYYLLVHYLPYFMRDEDAPHRQVCSLSKVVEMLAEHDSIKELRGKKY